MASDNAKRLAEKIRPFRVSAKSEDAIDRDVADLIDRELEGLLEAAELSRDFCGVHGVAESYHYSQMMCRE